MKLAQIDYVSARGRLKSKLSTVEGERKIGGGRKREIDFLFALPLKGEPSLTKVLIDEKLVLRAHMY